MQYIGITDFTNAGEVMNMLRIFNTYKPPWWEGLLHVGIMMSYKTLNEIPTKWKDAWPPKEDVKDIFLQNKNLLNVIHYADYEGINVFENLKKVHLLGGLNMHAIQLDMVWPDPEAIQKFRRDESEVGIILQINKKCLRLTGNDDSQLLRKIKEYGSSVNVVLLDMSAGKGIPLEPDFLIPKITMLKENLPEMEIAVAGGLGPDTINLMESIWKDYPEISIDAQGQLRSSKNALDPIDWKLAEDYLTGALKLLSR